MLDSRTVCGGLALMLLAATARAGTGDSLDEVAHHALQARDGVRVWFCLDTFEYPRHGGRIGGAQAWLGGGLTIKPILSLESEVKPVESVRTNRRAIGRGREVFGCGPLFVSEVGPVIGAHAGPGMVGIGALAQSLLLG
ncbi:hypothetical protein BH20ACT16_BH20ACT16_15980 [soil metagenome]